jgi:hypothetical protein
MATKYEFPIIIVVFIIIINIKIETPSEEGVSVVVRRKMSTHLTLDFKWYCLVQASILTAKRSFDRALKWTIIFLEVVGKIISDQSYVF